MDYLKVNNGIAQKCSNNFKHLHLCTLNSAYCSSNNNIIKWHTLCIYVRKTEDCLVAL